MSKNYTSNDMRSMAMNPNSSHYQASMDNHSNQMNPNNDSYWGSRNNIEYGLSDYVLDCPEFSDKAKEENVQMIANQIIDRWNNFESLRKEYVSLSSRTKRSKEIKEIIQKTNFTIQEVSFLFKNKQYQEYAVKIIEFFVNEKNQNKYASIYLYDSKYNIQYLDYFINQFLISLKNNYSNYYIRRNICDLTIDQQIAYFEKQIKKLEKPDTFKINALYNISSYICQFYFSLINSAISTKNIELAKLAHKKYVFRRNHFNLMEYNRTSEQNLKYRSLFNKSADEDWIKLLVSIGAKASTNELTTIFYKLYS